VEGSHRKDMSVFLLNQDVSLTVTEADTVAVNLRLERLPVGVSIGLFVHPVADDHAESFIRRRSTELRQSPSRGSLRVGRHLKNGTGVKGGQLLDARDPRRLLSHTG